MDQVRVINQLVGADFTWKRGRVLSVGLDLSEAEARQGIAAGHLAEIQAKSAHEQATVQAREAAVIPRGRSRRSA
jgi:hypothetical protein